MARTFTSELTVQLIDRVTGVSKRVGNSLRDLGRQVDRVNNQPPDFATRVDAALTRSQASLERARGGIVDAAAAFYTLKAAIAGPVQEATAFESAMADVKKVVDFPTPQAFKDFQKQLIDLSTEVPMTVNGLAEIAAAAGQAGIAGQDLIRFTETAAKVGTAFDITADDAGTAMAKMMTGLDLTIDEVTLLADSMNHLSNAQASSAAEILDVVRRAGAQGKQFGFTAEQTAAFASAMISAGAQSEVAATSFMNMGRALTRGASATKRQSAAFRTLGLDAEDVAKAMQEDAAGTTLDVMERMAKLPAHMRAAISSDLFGDEARALGPLLTNLDLTRESLGMVADEAIYAGSAFKEFEVRNATFGNRVATFNNRLTRLKITIGNALLPVLTDLMDRLAPIIEQVSGWIEANPKLTAGILSATAAMIAFKGAVAGLRFVGLLGATGALSMLSTAMHTIGRASGGMVGAARASIALQTALAAMDGAKIGALTKAGAAMRGIAGVVGLRAAAGAISAVVGAVGAISAPAWLGIAAAVAAVGVAWKYWDRISAIASGVGAAISGAVQPAMEWARDNLPGVAPAIDRVGSAFRSVGNAIDWAADKTRSLTAGLFTKEVLTDAEVSRIKASATEWTSWVISQAGKVVRFISGIDLAIAGGKIIGSLLTGMKEKFAEALAWAETVGPQIRAKIGDTAMSVLSGGRSDSGRAQTTIDADGNIKIDASGIAGARAKGGRISPGRSYLVGEEGAEVVTPSRSGYVHSSGRAPGGAPSVTVQVGDIIVQGAGDAQAVAEQVMRRLQAEVGGALRGAYADLGVS